ncbi:MAG: zf-HC2 protein [Dehalococcoidia bacterium]|nr:zf-HC2 protein [Dehalococcoidia bacterium]
MFERFSPGRHRRFRALLSPYLDGRLDDVQVRRLEQHLRTCAPCQGEMQTLRDTVGLLRSLPRALPRRSFTLAERPAVLPPTPAYLWGMRAATSVAAIALMLLFAGDFLGTFSREAAPAPDSGPATAQEAKSALAEPQEGAKTQEPPSAMAAEDPSTQIEDEAFAQAAAPGATDEEDVLPTTALEVALGGLLAALALITLFATRRLRRRRAML